MSTVTCIYPEDQFEDEGASPPEGFEEWRSSEECTHAYCIEADGAFRLWQGQSQGRMTKDERESMESDRELMLDEFHAVR